MCFIVDCTMPQHMQEKLKMYGTVYMSEKVQLEDFAVCGHPDLQIHFLEDNYAICAPEAYCHYLEILPKEIKLEKGNKFLEKRYPGNCAYNIARVGDYVLCNTRYADETILAWYKEKNYKIIHINQGYSKCNICIMSENEILTEDIGIDRAIREKTAIKSNLIEKGSVRLNGFDYGFIGGATGLCEDKIIFCGSIKNIESIKTVLGQKEYIELSDSALYDFGSIISF